MDNKIHLTLLSTLYRAFDHFNQTFSSSEPLPTPVINLGPAGKRPYYGWFRANSWTVKDKQTEGSDPLIPEINISPEYLDRKPEDVFETLLHEMAHLKNWVLGIKDCNASQYHNKKFKEQAENFGLSVSKMRNRGWAKTTLADAGKQAIDALTIDKNVFNIARPHHARLTENPYITIVLKKDQWSERLEKLVELAAKGTGEDVGNSGVVILALELAENYWASDTANFVKNDQND